MGFTAASDLLHALGELSADLIALARGGRIRHVNGAAVAALRYPSPDALLGRAVLDLVADGDRGLAEALLARADGGAGPAKQELRLVRSDGSHLAAEVSATAVAIDGERAVALLARDLGERRELEARLAAAERLSSLGTLAAGVAHEINNPVSYALANLGYVAERVAPVVAGSADAGEVASAVRDARQGLERVRDIVRDLKAFSRADDGSMGAIELHGLLDASCAMAAAEIRHRARLVRAYAPGVLHARGNEGKLAQVFLNLLVNAAQAIAPGAAGAHAVTVATSRREGGRVAVEVRDTGCGIAQEHLPRLFEPFFTTKPRGIGTGLGLSICHGIVRAHGGAIEVESERGRGACFRVVLDAAAAPVEAAPPAPSAPRDARSTVLVVDDEPLVCQAVARALDAHHEVVRVGGASAAMSLVRGGRRFDAILCDVMMPEATGLELHALLEREAPDQARRLAFITAGVFSEEARDLLRGTARPVVEKPFSKDALLACVRSLASE
jgi:PAS domain S-box-containing protein